MDEKSFTALRHGGPRAATGPLAGRAGIGPSLDIEMDTGRLGPLSTSLFLGARFYRIVGGRKVKFDSEVETFDDVLGQDSAVGHFNFEVDEWMYRIGVGLRFQWLGSKG